MQQPSMPHERKFRVVHHLRCKTSSVQIVFGPHHRYDGEISTIMKVMNIEQHIQGILHEIGEDPTRAGLVKTPARVMRSLQSLTEGYQMLVSDVVSGALFHAERQDMVLAKGMEFYSLCEHHMLPFSGHCHIAYIPNRHVIGLSKLARVMQVFTKRLQIQEKLTQEIASALSDVLQTEHVAVMMSAHHFCMSMRGVNIQQAQLQTSSYLGRFEQDSSLRQELLQQIKS